MTAGSVAILAGAGELPLLLADRLASAGRPLRILAIRGFSARATRARADAVVALLDIQRAFACLDRWKPGIVTLAGGLTRPSAAALAGAFSLVRNRDDIGRLIARGDDNLMRGVVELIEERGYPVAGVRELAPELLADQVVYGRRQPDAKDEAAISWGVRVLDAMSPFDIGQAVVVSGERVLAIEGPEGTDRTLARARAERERKLFRRARSGGVLVKAPKRGQDLRVDLPAIGPRTVANAAAAGLDGIAVAAGLTLVLNRRETVEAADRHGLFVVGIDPSRFTARDADAHG
ncbi:LpxI family protein [uncultured Enterovirga sp.]|uniref:LpxI family protein n=1 Tax=uncultured Enterovirga sp. TaxID=2026352 RepID=UPI0035CBFEC4